VSAVIKVIKVSFYFIIPRHIAILSMHISSFYVNKIV